MSVLQSERGQTIAASAGRSVVALIDPLQTHLSDYRGEKR